MRKEITVIFCVLLVSFLLSATAFAEEAPKLEGPFLVTTCEQNPGAVMLRMSAIQAGVQAEHDNTLSVECLKNKEVKTLIITTGTSMKGMGAAGTNVEKEIERCTALIASAKYSVMVVVGAHIEGMARRTDSSDEASIEAIMKETDVILVVQDSDSYVFFTGYARQARQTSD